MKLSHPWITKNLAGLSIASTMSDASHEFVPLVLPLLISQLVGNDAAPPYVALISGSATAAAGVSGLYAGSLSDHLVNRKPLIVGGYFLAGASVGLLAWATHWTTVFFLMMAGWIGRGIISAPRNALIADSTESAYYGRAFGLRQACDTLGSILGPLIVFMASGLGPHTIFLMTLIPSTLAILVVTALVKDVPHKVSPKNFSLFSLKNDLLPAPFWYLVSLFVLFGLGNFNKSMLVLRMQDLLDPHGTFENALPIITLLYIVRNIVQTFSSYALGALSDTMGRIIPLSIGGFGLFSILSFLLSFESSSAPLALTIFFLSGCSAGTVMSLQKSLAADLLPERLRGTGYAILTTADSFAALIASIMLGSIWKLTGPQAAFMLAGFISLLSVGVALLLYRLKKIP
jgi:MFS family permease